MGTGGVKRAISAWTDVCSVVVMTLAVQILPYGAFMGWVAVPGADTPRVTVVRPGHRSGWWSGLGWNRGLVGMRVAFGTPRSAWMRWALPVQAALGVIAGGLASSRAVRREPGISRLLLR